MPDIRFHASKIVATPTSTSWSQIYNAGSVYIILCLQSDEEKSLAQKGKELITLLEQEYFTLETKNFTSIKQAFSTVLKQAPDDVHLTLISVAFINGVAYLFVKGQGYIYIKRHKKILPLLEPHDELHGASGSIKEGDFLTLGTHSFFDTVQKDIVFSSQTPAELSEVATPLIHGQEDGLATGLGIWIGDPTPQAVPSEDHSFSSIEKRIPTKELEKERQEENEDVHNTAEHYPQSRESKPNKVVMTIRNIVRRFGMKKVFLAGVALGLIVILISSIISTLNDRQSNTYETLFAQVYPPAEKKFNEGKALLSLNKSLANDDFLAAKALLEEAKSKFPEDSEEYKKIDTLLQEVNSYVAGENQASVQLQETSFDKSPLLDAKHDNKNALVTKTNNDVFLLTGSGIEKNDSTNLVDKDWSKASGLGTFGSNFYVLDTGDEQIYKFTPTADGYAKTNYLAQSPPSLEDGVSLAIDGSVWILLSDGTIYKFTRGTQDAFAISGLTKPFSTPTQLFTNEETENLYILDPKNSRVVALEKNGTFVKTYTSENMKNAIMIDVDESNQKLYILSNNKIFETEL